MTNEELAQELNGVSVTAIATGLLNAGKFEEYLKKISPRRIETNSEQISEQERRKILGARVKTMRQLRGLKQSELAEQIGATQSFVTNIETGRRGASLNNLVALSQSLNVSVDWLIDVPPLKPE